MERCITVKSICLLLISLLFSGCAGLYLHTAPVMPVIKIEVDGWQYSVVDVIKFINRTYQDAAEFEEPLEYIKNLHQRVSILIYIAKNKETLIQNGFFECDPEEVLSPANFYWGDVGAMRLMEAWIIRDGSIVGRYEFDQALARITEEKMLEGKPDNYQSEFRRHETELRKKFTDLYDWGLKTLRQ